MQTRHSEEPVYVTLGRREPIRRRSGFGSDLRLPGMSGPELQQQLAKERAQARAHHRQRRSLRRWPKKRVELVAPTNSTVLIQGETGTG
jgi:transcriptional regulator with AAA-type ATPase domain